MEYLYALQTLREGAGSMLTPFFLAISEFAIVGGTLLLMFVYWCVDKRIGAWGMFNLTLANFLTNVIKVTACVNRPWVQDPRLRLADEVADTATGYSFPSGHTAAGAAAYGTMGVWQRKRRWVVALMAVLIVLTAFSRNWLGAHTLRDVCMSIALTAVVMVLTSLAMRHLDVHPNHDVTFAALICVMCAATVLYVSIKPFPLEYAATGALLVDPAQMTPDAWGSAGLTSGWAVSWVVERRFIGFDCGGTSGWKAIRFLVGMALFAVMYLAIMPAAVATLDPDLGELVKRFATIVVVGCFYPCLVKLVQSKRAPGAE
jgi:membrane-associated phospholipid phosphatase